METQRFPIRIGDRSRLLLRVIFGATPDRAWVTLDEDLVTARFGRWEIEVATDNITGWRIEGPWNWITAVGVRRSIRDGDLTFAGSPRGGVRLEFREPVKWTLFHVPAVDVGVEDLEGFGAALKALGIPGEDGREGREG